MARARLYVTESGEPIHGILAEFASPGDLYHACEAVRDAGYRRWDAYTPFPIHGMEEAMGIRRTRLPLVVAVIGLSCAGLGFLMQWWMNSQDYPLVTQGKPYNSWQAFVPVTFEIGILTTAFATLFGMFIANALPRHHHPLMRKDRFLSSSDDRFFVCIEASDPNFDPERIRSLFERARATSVELVEENAPAQGGNA
jgi:hypothetical protein